MKVKTGYILRKIAGHYVVLPSGARTVEFVGVITLNDSGAFLWENMNEDVTEEGLLEKLMTEYSIDRETALQDVQNFVALLEKNSLLDT